MLPVRADHHVGDELETVDPGNAVALRLDEREGPRREVPAENEERAHLDSRDIDGLPVAAERDRIGAAKLLQTRTHRVEEPDLGELIPRLDPGGDDEREKESE